jgi:sulfonate transport system substrate-binding protein
MNRFLGAVIAIGVLALASACTTSNAATDFGSGSTTLRIGDQQQSIQLSLQESGQLADIPYHVQFDQFGSGPLVNQAFQAGAIDLGFMGDTPAMFAQASKLPVTAIAVSTTDGPSTTLLTRSGSGIRTLADLKGKRVATTKNTAPHGFLLRALAKAGLSQQDITLVDVPLLNLGNILESGTVDAATVSQLQLVAYTKNHPDAVQLTNIKTLSASYGFELATKTALADPAKRAALKDLVARLVRANQWIKTHTDQWIDAYYVKYQKQSSENAKLIYFGSGASTYGPIDDKVLTNQQEQADLYTKNGLFPGRVDISPQFDDAVTAEFNKAVAAANAKAR